MSDFLTGNNRKTGTIGTIVSGVPLGAGIVLKPTFKINGVEYSTENYQLVGALRREIDELMQEQRTKELGHAFELSDKEEEIDRLKAEVKTQTDRAEKAEGAESDRSILITDNRFLTILCETLLTETTRR